MQLEPGQAIRISTGAPIPAGADAVCKQELTSTDEQAGTVTDRGARRRRASTCASRAATSPSDRPSCRRARCSPGPEIGVLAAVNIPRPSVVRRPRIALVSTGDELLDPGTPLKPGPDPGHELLRAERRGAAGRRGDRVAREGRRRPRADDRDDPRRARGRRHPRDDRRRLGRPARPRPPGAERARRRGDLRTREPATRRPDLLLRRAGRHAVLRAARQPRQRDRVLSPVRRGRRRRAARRARRSSAARRPPPPPSCRVASAARPRCAAAPSCDPTAGTSRRRRRIRTRTC